MRCRHILVEKFNVLCIRKGLCSEKSCQYLIALFAQIFTHGRFVLHLDLLSHTILNSRHELFSAHRLDVRFDLRGIFNAHLLRICLDGKLNQLLFRIFCQHSGNHHFQLCGRNLRFDINVKRRLLLNGERSHIILEQAYLFFVGNLVVTGFERKSADNILGRICKLLLHDLALRHAIDRVFGKSSRIADGAGHHRSNRVFVGTDNTGNLQVDCLIGIIKEFDTRRRFSEVDIRAV